MRLKKINRSTALIGTIALSLTNSLTVASSYLLTNLMVAGVIGGDCRDKMADRLLRSYR